MTLGEYLEQWLASLGMAQLEPTTLSWYWSAIQSHIVPMLGRVKLAKLDALTIEAFLADKAAHGRLAGKGKAARYGGLPLGAASVRRLQITLHAALDAAVRTGLLFANPADIAARPKVPTRDVTVDAWAPEQVAAFLAATASDRLAPLWRLQSMTGLRRSEIVGLWWPDVDLEAGTLTVRRAVVLVDGKPHIKAPKTARSRRTVELDAGTVVSLRRWRVAQMEERLRAGSAWTSGEWVFTDELGRSLHPESISTRFERIVREAALPPITVKGLRHSHATALLKSGANPKVVAERLGHSSISVTLDIYSAVLPNMQRAAVEHLAASLGGE